jgi:hypothetical protein
MAADEQGRVLVERSPHTATGGLSLPGWLQLLLAVASAAALCAIAHFAGAPGAWTPLVFGGGLGLMAALVTGSPGRDDG